MDNCTYGFHSYEHDDSFESYLECLHRHMNDTQNGDEDEFVSSIGVGIVLGLLALVTVAGKVSQINLYLSSIIFTVNAEMKQCM